MDKMSLALVENIGRPEIVDALIRAGGSPNAEHDGHGGTLLHEAVAFRAKQTINVLIAHGADLEAENRDGDVPLHLAAVQNDLDMMEILLRAGAKVNAMNSIRLTALDLVRDDECHTMLLAYGAKPGRQISDVGDKPSETSWVVEKNRLDWMEDNPQEGIALLQRMIDAHPKGQHSLRLRIDRAMRGSLSRQSIANGWHVGDQCCFDHPRSGSRVIGKIISYDQGDDVIAVEEDGTGEIFRQRNWIAHLSGVPSRRENDQP